MQASNVSPPVTTWAFTIFHCKERDNPFEPQFSEQGYNSRTFENAVYAKFMKYLREAASKSIEHFSTGLHLASPKDMQNQLQFNPQMKTTLKHTVEKSFQICNQCCPGFDSKAWHQKWVFLWELQFSPLPKNQHFI